MITFHADRWLKDLVWSCVLIVLIQASLVFTPHTKSDEKQIFYWAAVLKCAEKMCGMFIYNFFLFIHHHSPIEVIETKRFVSMERGWIQSRSLFVKKKKALWFSRTSSENIWWWAGSHSFSCGSLCWHATEAFIRLYFRLILFYHRG